MIDNKYTFTEETKDYNGRILKRIKAVKQFDNVRKGEVGGWIEDEKNLSQEGNCWVYDNAKVYGNARVCGKTQVFGSARVCGNIHVSGKARIWK